MEDETVQLYPIQDLAQKRHLLLAETCPDRDRLRREVLAIVKDNAMLPYYEKYLCPAALGPADEALKAEMKKSNDEDLAKLEERIKDATENLGDMEVRDALLAKAVFFNRIGDKDAAIQAYQESFAKSMGIGGKLDNILTVIRIGFFFDDLDLVKKEMDRAKDELKKGGDWERRNKLKVYEGMYLMCTRNWKDAATLFLNAMPTFTAVELVELKDFVLYAVILTLVSLDRTHLREQLISSPEVLGSIKDTPHLEDYLDSFYYCKYRTFNEKFVHIVDTIRSDRYLCRHARFFTRTMRLNAYKQFLASYRSVKLESMALEFGVSKGFLDEELSSFISSGRLTCKIDKVGELIESNEADSRSKLYIDIIKQGDLLLNRMQKLSGAMDM